MRQFLMLLWVWLFATACQENTNSRNQRIENIRELESQLFQSNNELNHVKAVELISAYESFAESMPDDSLSPAYLFRAADVAMGMQKSQKALELFDHLIWKYPEYNKTPSAYFLKGFIYEEQIHDLKMAAEQYHLFIEKFPEHEFADDAKISLQNLGKSPEELIREFEQKQLQ